MATKTSDLKVTGSNCLSLITVIKIINSPILHYKLFFRIKRFFKKRPKVKYMPDEVKNGNYTHGSAKFDMETEELQIPRKINFLIQ
jgi:hypothetical protein